MVRLRREQREALKAAKRRRAQAELPDQFRQQGFEVVAVTETGAVTVERADTGPVTVALTDKGYHLESAAGQHTHLEMDDFGRITGYRQGAGAGVQFTYHRDGSIAKADRGEGGVYSTGLNCSGLPTTITDPLGNTTHFEHNQDGRLVKVTNRDQGETHYQHDDHGRTTYCRDAKGATTQFDYDQWDHPIAMHLPNSQTLAFGYAPDGQLQHWSIDGERQATLTTNVAAGTREATYRDGCRVALKVDAGKVMQVVNETVAVAFDYDGQGRLVAEQCDDQSVTLVRDAGGDLIAQTNAAGTLHYERDADGRVARIVDWDGGTLTFDYDDGGALARITYPNGVVHEQHNTTIGLPASCRLKDPAGLSLAEYRWTYDRNDRLIESVANQQSRHFSYTNEGALCTVRADEPLWCERFERDAVGNTLEDDHHNYSYNGADQLITVDDLTTDHDPYGNLVAFPTPAGDNARARFNARGHLVELAIDGRLVHYSYDGLGRRRQKSANGVVTHYQWAGTRLIAETRIDADGREQRRDFLYLEDTSLPLAMRVNGCITYLHFGRRGEILCATDTAGRVVWKATYTAFGTAVTEVNDIDQPFRLLGQYHDAESGLHYSLSRYYHPRFGRFLSRDPLYTDGGSSNFYLYCKGDPLNAADPTGAFIIPALLIGAVVSAVISAGIEATCQYVEHGEIKDPWNVVKEGVIGGVVGFLSFGVGGTVAGVASKALSKVATRIGSRAVTAVTLVVSEAAALVTEVCADNLLRGRLPTLADFTDPWNFAGYALEPIGKLVKNIFRRGKVDDALSSGLKPDVDTPPAKADAPTNTDTAPAKAAVDPPTKADADSGDTTKTNDTNNDAERMQQESCGDKGCNAAGEPVSVVSGAMFHHFEDYRNGPFAWTRTYRSAHADFDGPLGPGFWHAYQRCLVFDKDCWHYINHEGLRLPLNNLEVVNSTDAAEGIRFRRTATDRFEVREPGSLVFTFHIHEERSRARLIAQSSLAGTLAFHYNSQGLLSEIHAREVNASKSHQYRVSWLDDRISDILHFPPGQMVPQTLLRYRYDDAGCLVSFRDCTNAEAAYTYVEPGLMSSLGDRNGYRFTYSYDDQGRCTRCEGQDGLLAADFHYDPANRVTRVRYDNGAVWTFHYNDQGVITGLTFPDGGHTDRLVDDQGRVVKEVGPGNSGRTLHYNDFGDHNGATNLLNKQIAVRGQTPLPDDDPHTIMPQSSQGWLLGKLTGPSAALAHRVQPFAKDPVLSRQDWFLYRMLVRWLQQSETVEQARIKRFPAKFDLLQRPTEWYDAGLVQVRYDAEGNQTHRRDRDGFETQYRYSSWSKVIERENAEGHTISYGYQSHGFLEQVVDGGGVETRYTWDNNNRLSRVERDGTLRETYHYDQANNLVDKFAGDGRLLFHCEYDEMGRLTERDAADGVQLRFGYDAQNRCNASSVGDTFCQTEFGPNNRRLCDKRDGRGVTHEYDRDGVLQTTQYFDQWTVHYQKRNETWQVTDPTGANHRLISSDTGLFQRETADGSNELMRFDKRGRCIFKSVARRKETIAKRWQRVYYYSAEGDLIESDDSMLGKHRYRYDRAHRLTSIADHSGEQARFRYDAGDNLLEAPTLADTELAGANRLARANGWFFSYNERGAMHARGQQTQEIRYRYNCFDQLIEIQGLDKPWHAGYDAHGRRIWKRVGGQQTDYFWDGNRLAAERYANGATRLYIYPDDAALVPMLIVDIADEHNDPASTAVYTVFADHLGAPVLIRDHHGNDVWFARYDAYGHADIDPGAQITCHLRRPGHYHDAETGLCYNRYRYYDPRLGRYLQPDPIGLAGGYNVYAYTPSPLSAVDLLGLSAKKCQNQSANQPDTAAQKGVEGTPDPDPPKTSGIHAVPLDDEIIEITKKLDYVTRVGVRASNRALENLAKDGKWWAKYALANPDEPFAKMFRGIVVHHIASRRAKKMVNKGLLPKNIKINEAFGNGNRLRPDFILERNGLTYVWDIKTMSGAKDIMKYKDYADHLMSIIYN